MKNRLWIVARMVDGKWAIVAAFVETDSDAATKCYNELPGVKLLMLWTVVGGVEIWRNRSANCLYGEELHHSPLPWTWLQAHDRVQLGAMVYETVIQFIQAPDSL